MVYYTAAYGILKNIAVCHEAVYCLFLRECNLVDLLQIDYVGEMHTAIGDPEVGVPKTFRLVYG